MSPFVQFRNVPFLNPHFGRPRSSRHAGDPSFPPLPASTPAATAAPPSPSRSSPSARTPTPTAASSQRPRTMSPCTTAPALEPVVRRTVDQHQVPHAIPPPARMNPGPTRHPRPPQAVPPPSNTEASPPTAGGHGPPPASRARTSARRPGTARATAQVPPSEPPRRWRCSAACRDDPTPDPPRSR